MIVALVLVVSTLSGCGLGQVLGAGVNDRERQQARDELARWAAAVKAAGGQQTFVPVGELTAQVGDWELEVGDNNKMALAAGMVVSAIPLPVNVPAEADVRWDDGTARKMPTISAAQALEELRATGGGGCPECIPLAVTAARLSTATVQTSRGPAIAPAWEFTLKGTKVLVTRIAISTHDMITVPPPAWDPNNSPAGMFIESATTVTGSTQLTVGFTGAPETSAKPCGEDYTTEAVESDTGAVVIVVRHRNITLGACTLEGARRTATANLAAPLGDRTLLEVTQGLPVPVVTTR